LRVTDESVARVPRIESDVLDERHWDTLQQKHRALLEAVRDLPIGTECMMAFDLSMNQLGDAIGLPGDHSVSMKRYKTPHILIHNHADSSPLSLDDFESFVIRPGTLSLTAVGHDGTVSILEKLPGYDTAGVRHKYMGTISNLEAALSNGEQHGEVSNITEQFLSSLSEYGFRYRRWK